jgi:hypothetical protein
MNSILTKTQQAAVHSYLRSVLATTIAAVMAGAKDWSSIGAAFIAAALPPIMRYLNPNDSGFGVGSK